MDAVFGNSPYLTRGLERRPHLLTDWATSGPDHVVDMALGTLLGAASALLIVAFRPARDWLLPVLVVSQAIPVFALAPLLVLWFGYGLASKVAMATLIIY